MRASSLLHGWLPNGRHIGLRFAGEALAPKKQPEAFASLNGRPAYRRRVSFRDFYHVVVPERTGCLTGVALVTKEGIEY